MRATTTGPPAGGAGVPVADGAAAAVEAELVALADPDDERRAAKARYFRTVPGDDAQGDRFLGVGVPAVRHVVRRHRGSAALADVEALLGSSWHEVRLAGCLLLVEVFRRSDAAGQDACVRLLLHRSDRLDNWDLVDSTAPYVLGPWVLTHDAAVLEELARSSLVWDRRMAVLATFALIRAGRYDDTLRLAERLLEDPHDLVHKAVGWMLREVGARDRAVLDAFLDAYVQRMPRVMLRYALEKHDPGQRRRWTRR